MRNWIAVIALLMVGACGGDSDVTNPPGAQQFTLTVSGSGSGSGTVQTSAGTVPALDCTLAANTQPAGTCSATYAEGAAVPITVTPGANSTFDGWSGDASTCSTAPSCSVSMTQNKTAVAQLSAGGGASGVQITSSTYYIDPNFGIDGGVIWVVEVRNTSAQLVELAEIDYASHDAAGEILGSDFTFVGPIPPGETRASQSVAELLGGETTIDFQVADVELGTGDGGLSAAQISSSNWRVDQNTGTNGAIVWTVEVLNTSSAPLESVQVDFVTYDAAGKVVAADFTFVGPIPPGEKRASESFADLHGNEANVKFQIASVR